MMCVSTHPEEQRVLAHSLNWLEEVGTDLFFSLTTEQHAALHICKACMCISIIIISL